MALGGYIAEVRAEHFARLQSDIAELLRSGMTQRAIMAEVGIGRTALRTILQKQAT